MMTRDQMLAHLRTADALRARRLRMGIIRSGACWSGRTIVC